jgi:type IV secretory pathway VirB6-like protein
MIRRMVCLLLMGLLVVGCDSGTNKETCFINGKEVRDNNTNGYTRALDISKPAMWATTSSYMSSDKTTMTFQGWYNQCPFPDKPYALMSDGKKDINIDSYEFNGTFSSSTQSIGVTDSLLQRGGRLLVILTNTDGLDPRDFAIEFVTADGLVERYDWSNDTVITPTGEYSSFAYWNFRFATVYPPGYPQWLDNQLVGTPTLAGVPKDYRHVRIVRKQGDKSGTLSWLFNYLPPGCIKYGAQGLELTWAPFKSNPNKVNPDSLPRYRLESSVVLHDHIATWAEANGFALELNSEFYARPIGNFSSSQTISGMLTVRSEWPRDDEFKISAPPLSDIFKPTIDWASTFSLTFAEGAVKAFNMGWIPRAVQVLLTLYAIVQIYLFLSGEAKLSPYELVQHILKIALVAMFIAPNQWTFLYDHFFVIFDKGVNFLAYAFGGGLVDQASPLKSLDRIIHLIFSPGVWLAIMAYFTMFLLFLGPILAITGVFSLLSLFTGIVKISIAYVMNLMILGLLMAMAPVFVCFLLFKITSNFFQSWIRLLIRYVLEIAFLIVGMTILTEMTYDLMQSTFQTSSNCFRCAMPIYMTGPLEEAGAFLSKNKESPMLGCLNGYTPWGSDDRQAQAGVMDELMNFFGRILLLFMMSRLFRDYPSLLQKTLSAMTGTQDYFDSSLVNVGAQMWNNAKGGIAEIGALTSQSRDSKDQARARRTPGTPPGDTGVAGRATPNDQAHNPSATGGDRT